MPPTQGQDTQAEDDITVTTEHVISQKRKLFEQNDWKPWGFDADALFDKSLGKIVDIPLLFG